MIIDVHRHLVAVGTVQGDYIRGAQRSFAMMYRKTHNLDISDRDFTEKVVRPLIDPQADNIVAEMDGAGVDKTIIFGVDYGNRLTWVRFARLLGKGFPCTQTATWAYHSLPWFTWQLPFQI